MDPIVEAISDSINSRHRAAEILGKVAEDGRCGCFPADVTCEQIGEALERILVNAPGDCPFDRVVSGWQKAAYARADRERSKGTEAGT